MIHLLYADVSPLDDDGIFQSVYDNSSPERQKKTDTFRFRKDKNLSLGASFLIDCGLKKFRLSEKNMTCGTKENGKPYFVERPDIFFNVSHSGKYAAAAFSDSEIGVDIEEIKAADLKIAKRFFTAEEYEYLEAIKDEEKRNSEFYRLWTLKESFMKITGLGMKLPLNEFCINIENGISVKCDKTDGNFYFYEYNGIGGYHVSVCSSNKNEKPDIENIGFMKG